MIGIKISHCSSSITVSLSSNSSSLAKRSSSTSGAGTIWGGGGFISFNTSKQMDVGTIWGREVFKEIRKNKVLTFHLLFQNNIFYHNKCQWYSCSRSRRRDGHWTHFWLWTIYMYTTDVASAVTRMMIVMAVLTITWLEVVQITEKVR